MQGAGCLPTHYSTQPFCHGNQQSNMSTGSSKTSLSLAPASSNTIPVQFRTQKHPCEWTMVKEKNAEYCDVYDVSLSLPAYFCIDLDLFVPRCSSISKIHME